MHNHLQECRPPTRQQRPLILLVHTHDDPEANLDPFSADEFIATPKHHSTATVAFTTRPREGAQFGIGAAAPKRPRPPVCTFLVCAVGRVEGEGRVDSLVATPRFWRTGGSANWQQRNGEWEWE